MLSWEQLTAIAALGQLVVFVAGAYLAYLQLRGLRHQREAQLIEDIFDRLNGAEIATALAYVYDVLPQKLREPEYVREIDEGKATVASHPELAVMHFFNGLGLLVHTKMVDEYPIVPFVASPCMRAWNQVAPVVELMRRHYPHAYTPFESLVARSRAVDLSSLNPRFRAETPQLKAQWQSTARDLVEKRIGLLDDPSAGESPANVDVPKSS
jgi:hypothetical protein